MLRRGRRRRRSRSRACGGSRFLGDLAEFHSRLGRRCLYLVQRHYTEPRLIKVQGLFGPDLTPGFMGADLMGQADVQGVCRSRWR